MKKLLRFLLAMNALGAVELTRDDVINIMADGTKIDGTKVDKKDVILKMFETKMINGVKCAIIKKEYVNPVDKSVLLAKYNGNPVELFTYVKLDQEILDKIKKIGFPIQLTYYIDDDSVLKSINNNTFDFQGKAKKYTIYSQVDSTGIKFSIRTGDPMDRDTLKAFKNLLDELLANEVEFVRFVKFMLNAGLIQDSDESSILLRWLRNCAYLTDQDIEKIVRLLIKTQDQTGINMEIIKKTGVDFEVIGEELYCLMPEKSLFDILTLVGSEDMQRAFLKFYEGEKHQQGANPVLVFIYKESYIWVLNYKTYDYNTERSDCHLINEQIEFRGSFGELLQTANKELAIALLNDKDFIQKLVLTKLDLGDLQKARLDGEVQKELDKVVNTLKAHMFSSKSEEEVGDRRADGDTRPRVDVERVASEPKVDLTDEGNLAFQRVEEPREIKQPEVQLISVRHTNPMRVDPDSPRSVSPDDSFGFLKLPSDILTPLEDARITEAVFPKAVAEERHEGPEAKIEKQEVTSEESHTKVESVQPKSWSFGPIFWIMVFVVVGAGMLLFIKMQKSSGPLNAKTF